MRPLIKISLLLLCLMPVCNLYAQGNKQAAVDSMLKVLSTSKPDTNKANLLYELNVAYDGTDQNKALAYAKQGYQLAEQLKWKSGMVLGLRYIGSLQMDMGKNDEALANYENSYKLSEELKSTDEMIMSLNNIGAVYERTSKYTKSADHFFRALKIAEDAKKVGMIAKCESNIAVLFIQQRDFEKAKVHAQKADQQYKHLQQPLYEAKNLEILGDSYAFDGKYEEAKPYYLRALRSYQQAGDQMGMATVYTQMVECYSNDPIRRIQYLQKAKALWDKLAPNNLNAIANIGNFGYSYFDIIKKPAMLKLVQDSLGLNKAQMLRDADAYFKQSIALCKQQGVPDLMSQLTIAYADLCEYQGDHKGALENVKEHYKLQDSISSQEIKNKIARLESEREIAMRDKKIQLSKLQIKQLWIYGLITVCVVVLLSFYFLNRSRIGQLKLKNELQRKEAEEQTKELLYRNKLSESELKAIRAQMNPHFIFNVLNSIESYIVENDPKTASRLVQKFASLSRLILENSTQSMVTADREWKALNLYTELEAMRFSNQFSYSFYVDLKLDLTKFMLPPMLVQPLIENAIHHGIRNATAENSRISITLEETGNELCFTVDDNGIGIDETEGFKTFSAIKSRSIGLSAIRERIEIFNAMNEKGAASFTIRKKEPNEGTGTIAISSSLKF